MIQDIGPHILRNTYEPGRTPDKDSLIVHFNDDGVLALTARSDEGSRKVFPRLSSFDLEDPSLVYLFTVDDDRFFLLEDTLPGERVPEGYSHQSIRGLRRSDDVSRKSVFEIFTAKQLSSWYRNNRYCGRCSAKTEKSAVERALVCPSCGNTIYPRVVPAVIVGVIDRENDRILLTKYRGREITYHALVAGFTEIGETLEQTVEREVMEETGLRVKNIRYYKSQPWGVADDILTGFYCDLDGSNEIRMDNEELSEAGWFGRDEVRLQPDDLSLTNEMMSNFKNGMSV